jgi:hypothetical protein
MFETPKIRVSPTGTKSWHNDAGPHRTNGPAIEWDSGSKEWWLNGERHRTDGPAVVRHDSRKEWWLNGKEVSWRDLYRQANDPEIELRILLAALTIS